MTELREIPTLEVSHLWEFHFGNSQWNFFDGDKLFAINRLKEARNKLNFPLSPHRKTVNDLIFITKGQSTRSKGLNQYVFEENQFFFLPALQITAHEYMSEDIEGFYLHFSPDLFSDLIHLLKPFPFLNFNTNPIVAIPESEVPFFTNILERLLSLYQSKSHQENKKLMVWYLLALFTEAHKFSAVPVNNVKDSSAVLTQQFKDLLTQQIYSCRTVKEFAQILHVTPNHLNKCVKKTVQKTAQELFNEMLILEAKSLLKYSNLTIAQIADRLYGGTSSNFSRFFKKQTGVSPKDYFKQ